MKIIWGAAVLVALATVPAHAQGYGGSLQGPTSFPTLPWTAPATPLAVEYSGTDATFELSTFVTFEGAVARGNAVLKQETKTVAQAAAESRLAAKATPKAKIVQDDHGNATLAKGY
jgi:hypothetical protein